MYNQYLICVYSFVNTWFDLHYVILFCSFYAVFTGKSGKTHRENPFSLSARAQCQTASLTDVRVRISNKNNGGLNISKRENSKLWRAVFPNCAPVSLGEQRILVKQVFIY